MAGWFLRYCTGTWRTFPPRRSCQSRPGATKLENPATQNETYAGVRRRLSLVVLVLVNLLPLAGVLFFDWDVAALVILYWSENLVLHL